MGRCVSWGFSKPHGVPLGRLGKQQRDSRKTAFSLRLRQWEPTSSCPDHPQGRWLNREGRIQPAVNSCDTWPGALLSQNHSSLWSGDVSRDLKPMAAMSINTPGPRCAKQMPFQLCSSWLKWAFLHPGHRPARGEKPVPTDSGAQEIAGFETHEKGREGVADSEPVAPVNHWRSPLLAASYQITGKNGLISL